MKIGIVSSTQISTPVHGDSTSLHARDHLPGCSRTAYLDQQAHAYALCAQLCAGSPLASLQLVRQAQQLHGWSEEEKTAIWAIMSRIAVDMQKNATRLMEKVRKQGGPR